MTLEERLERARTFRAKGYNCAQCVCVAFPDISGMSDEEALRTAIGLGGGCGCGEICGVLSAMALLCGRLTQGAADEKAPVYAAMRELHDIFAAEFGSVVCRELKCPGAKVPCNTLIERGIEMFHDFISRNAQ